MGTAYIIALCKPESAFRKMLWFIPLQPRVAFLYPLKTAENLWV